ncbi:MAG: hypothetical protein AAFZ18_09155 [Myxococcota bacterium]
MAVSTEHEQLLELFRDRKTLLGELLTPLGVELGDGEPEEASGDVTQPKPIVRAADLVLLHRRGGELALVTAVEVQLERDPDKPFRWPLYAATLWDRHRARRWPSSW